MQRGRRQGGTIVVLAAVAAFAAVAALLLLSGVSRFGADRDRASDRALAQAREALIAYASERPITAVVGPGYLPCPDLDDDGWAESTCGSLAGDRGMDERLGRLPWKTLGLPDLRDGHGERLWYAVATRYKGLLNCAASAACVDMTPSTARGTITVRDMAGRVTHDGTLADAERAGAAAIVVAPGPPLDRLGASGGQPREQRRDCPPPDCDGAGRCLTQPPRLAPRCDPANYLDAAPAERSGEDNADFHDRIDAGRSGNGNGFIQGPVLDAQGRRVVNDRLAVVAEADLMPRVMRRVALEVAHCLSFYASRPENLGRLPPPEAACAGAAPTPPLGRVPDTPFGTPPGMLDRWWRASTREPESLGELPTRAHACRIAAPPADDGPMRTQPPGSPAGEGATAGGETHAWWRYWKPFVLYAPAAGLQADGCREPGACLDLVDGEGRLIAGGRRFAVVVTPRAGQCESQRLPCEAGRCRRVLADAPGQSRHEVALALP